MGDKQLNVSPTQLNCLIDPRYRLFSALQVDQFTMFADNDRVRSMSQMGEERGDGVEMERCVRIRMKEGKCLETPVGQVS